MMRTIKVLVFFVLVGPALNANAANKRMDQSLALFQVINAFEEARYDLDGHYEVTQKVAHISEQRVCDIVASETIVEHFKTAIKHYRAFYPDEELPFEKATQDLQNFVGLGSEYQQCVEKFANDYEELEVTHYLSVDTGINIRFEFTREY